MPVVDYAFARTWRQLYRWQVVRDTDHPLLGETVGYSRSGAYFLKAPYRSGRLEWHLDYWEALTSKVSIPQDAAVLFVGCGFGWLGESARSLGWSRLAFQDTSPWIHAHKGELGYRWSGEGPDDPLGTWEKDTPNAVEDIIELPLSPRGPLLRRLVPVFGGNGLPDVIVTESVVSGLLSPTMGELFEPDRGDTDELSEFFDACDGLGAETVVHIADLSAQAPFNVLALEEWKAERLMHRFAPSGRLHDFRVL